MPDRAALVTGASSGIGLAIARMLGEEGYALTAAARRPEKLDEAAAGLRDAGFAVEAVAANLTDEEDIRRVVAAHRERWGRLDVLVNNAGVTGPLRDVHRYDGDDAATVLLTNVVGYVRVIHAFLPLLERAADPRIVNVSSGLGSFALFHDAGRIESRVGTPLYGAAKSAVNMLTARYARLLPGIRINAADPGQTATDLSGGQGHSLADGTDAIIALALGGPDTPTGAYRDRDGDLPW